MDYFSAAPGFFTVNPTSGVITVYNAGLQTAIEQTYTVSIKNKQLVEIYLFKIKKNFWFISLK